MFLSTIQTGGGEGRQRKKEPADRHPHHHIIESTNVIQARGAPGTEFNKHSTDHHMEKKSAVQRTSTLGTKSLAQSATVVTTTATTASTKAMGPSGKGDSQHAVEVIM
jgi:uncharacterized lipoprotein NlpE involved in copper resistance